MKGIMIDCSRLCERPNYYHELVDLVADCGGDTLVLHFCDDHGLGLALPGFEDLAHPWALDPQQLAALLAHAAARGIELVPEVECFGHVRYLLVRPHLRSAFIGDPDSRQLVYNAIAPDHEAGVATVLDLLDATMAAFPDARRIHIGCDEVDLGDYCAARGLDDAAAVWCAHVDRVIDRICAAGRQPIMWADHLEQDPAVLAGIDRRVGVVSWHYQPTVDPSGPRTLAAAGFAELVLAPAASCWLTRCHPHQGNLDNQRRMAALAAELDAGYLSTVWCPYRHLQGALFPALAEGLLRAVHGVEPEREAVAAIALGSAEPAIAHAAADLARIGCDHDLLEHLVAGRPLDAATAERARGTVALGAELIPRWRSLAPPPRAERWAALLLAARCACHLARLALDRTCLVQAGMLAEHRELVALLELDWERSRQPQDPARHRETFANEGSHHLLACFRRWAREGLPALDPVEA